MERIDKSKVLNIIDNVLIYGGHQSIRDSLNAVRHHVESLSDLSQGDPFRGKLIVKVCDSCKTLDNRQNCPFGWPCEITFDWDYILERFNDADGADMGLVHGKSTSDIMTHLP